MLNLSTTLLAYQQATLVYSFLETSKNHNLTIGILVLKHTVHTNKLNLLSFTWAVFMPPSSSSCPWRSSRSFIKSCFCFSTWNHNDLLEEWANKHNAMHLTAHVNWCVACVHVHSTVGHLCKNNAYSSTSSLFIFQIFLQFLYFCLNAQDTITNDTNKYTTILLSYL